MKLQSNWLFVTIDSKSAQVIYTWREKPRLKISEMILQYALGINISI